MKTRHRLLLLVVLAVTVAVGFSMLTQFDNDSPGVTKTSQESGSSMLKYKLSTNGPWAYIELLASDAKMGLLEQDAKLLSELDKAVSASGNKCGEHQIRYVGSALKGVLCKVEEK